MSIWSEYFFYESGCFRDWGRMPSDSTIQNHAVKTIEEYSAFILKGLAPIPTTDFILRFLPPEELGPLLDLLPPSHIHGDTMTKRLIRYLGLDRLEEAQGIISWREKTRE